ncbi:MAG: deoxycytidyl transferase [Thelocarpon superellum]|nr:MAG: deoxycytidyl transferase [Thelocarpon superellum]
MAGRMNAPEGNAAAVRKRIENHTFENEDGDEYEGSTFGGFTEYFRRKKIKLQNRDVDLRGSAPDHPHIFRGVVAHVNGYTQPSLNDLHTLIVSHGGGFMQYLDGKTTVTHIIAHALTPKKRVEFRRYRMVKPAWVVESIKAGKLLPWNDFRLVDEGEGQKVLGFENGNVVSQTNQKIGGYRDESIGRRMANYVHDVAEEMDHRPVAAFPPPQDAPDRPGDAPKAIEAPLRRSTGVSEDVHRLLEDVADAADLDELQDVDVKGQLGGLASNDQGPAAEGPTSTRQVSSADHSPPVRDQPSPVKGRKMTAEEHNMALLADPRIRNASVLNPNFIKQYYAESRLHHLSTWKATLKAQLQRVTAEKSSSQRAALTRPSGSRRYILHVDFDSFFAAVSLKNAPHLKDKPVVVAHGNGTGSEIASCNYVARSFGVKNGMWMKQAQNLCPEVQVLPYDFKAYEDASRHFYDAVLRTGGIVQSVSIDEALVDVTDLCLAAGGTDGRAIQEGSISREQVMAEEIARDVRARVMEKTACAVSVGIGGNILLAKVALRKAKPAGQYHIKPEEALDFLATLPVRDLPGVAYSIGGKLEEIGAVLIQHVRALTKEKLVSTLGPKTGDKIWNYARGIDRSEVAEQVVRKSVSAEVNWGVRFETQAQADEFVDNLCGELHSRLEEQKVKGRHLTMKVMRRAQDAPLDPPKHLGHGKCDVYNKSVVLGVATTSHEILAREALSILKALNFAPGELRGLGVQMTKLEPLKETVEGQAESSQKRLQFKAPSTVTPLKKEAADLILDDPDRPSTETIRAPSVVGSVKQEDRLPKPLNTLGTQFLVPSQVDPAVLAELPESIRKKVLQSHKGSTRTGSPSRRAGSPTPFPAPTSALLQPNAETLEALPAEPKQEVLKHMSRNPVKGQGHALRPQSPHKGHALGNSKGKRATTPSKRRGGLSNRGAKGGGKSESHSTLTQSNFVSRASAANPPPTTDYSGTESGDEGGVQETDISPDFLEALPDDIRREILLEAKRERLNRRSQLDFSLPRATTPAPSRHAPPPPPPPPPPPADQPVISFTSRAGPKPTFTSKQLSTLAELRSAVSAWVSSLADEGPHDDDVQALARYLRLVVAEERNLEKARAVLKWFKWVVHVEVEEGQTTPQGGGDGAVIAWAAAVSVVDDAMQTAVRERGLGPLVV